MNAEYQAMSLIRDHPELDNVQISKRTGVKRARITKLRRQMAEPFPEKQQ